MSVVDEPDLVDEPDGPDPDAAKRAKQSRFWRTMWRFHFYSGIIAVPALLVLAVSGLGILYTDQLNAIDDAGLHRTTVDGTPLPLSEQVAAAKEAYPDLPVGAVTPPRRDGDTTRVDLADGEETRQVFVEPASGKVLGSKVAGDDLVGLVNRLHGDFNLGIEIPFPTVAGLVGQSEEGVFAATSLGGLIMEIIGCWAVLLAITGLYLWWPRKRETGKALFVPRLSKGGRARWRDLHAIPGVLYAVVLLFLITTGMPWSDFWGPGFGLASDKANSGYNWPDTPPSPVATIGDLDRFGNRINWAAEDGQVPGSDPGASGAVPAAISVDAVQTIAAEEQMEPGYSISFPANEPGEDGEMAYGSFAVGNPWPDRLHTQRQLFVGQFSGATLLDYSADDYGTMARAAEFGIQGHMGTQYGWFNRLLMTLAAVGVIWSSITAVIMWWKRRPQGKAGIPRRPMDVRLQRGLIVLLVIWGIIYPLAGVSMIIVLAIDKFIIRKVPKLRRTFGMRDPVDVLAMATAGEATTDDGPSSDDSPTGPAPNAGPI